MKRTMKRIAVCVLVLGVVAFAGAAAAGENARDSIAGGSLERSLPQSGAQEMMVRTAGSYGTPAHDGGDQYHRGGDHDDHGDHGDHGGHNGGGGGC